MLYYLLFWTILGFIFHFYITFGTNLLTQGPVQITVFLPILVFRRKGISNGMKPSGTWFSHQIWSRRLGPSVKKEERRSRGWRHPPRVRPLPRRLLVGFLTSTPSLLDHICSKNNSPEGFIPFDIPFIQNTEIGKKKTIRVGPPISRLVPKMI